MSLFKSFSKLSYDIKKILISMVFKTIIFSLLLIYLCIFLPSTKNYEDSFLSLDNDLSLNVGNFDSNCYLYNNDIEEFLNQTFSTRNQCFLDGSVEKLYNFYNIDSNNGRLSLKYEFKRIAYLRDWAIERKIIFTNIESSIIIKEIKSTGSKLTIKALEDCNFTYIYSNSPLDNKFKVQIMHTLTVNTADDKLIIDKDYFLDFIGSETNNYSFSLKEKSISHSKSVDKNFVINKSLKTNEVLSYNKFAFCDHKATVCGYDNMGYPLVTSSTLKTSNIPFDLGWNTKHIKVTN